MFPWYICDPIIGHPDSLGQEGLQALVDFVHGQAHHGKVRPVDSFNPNHPEPILCAISTRLIKWFVGIYIVLYLVRGQPAKCYVSSVIENIRFISIHQAYGGYDGVGLS